ncbi:MULTISPECIES: hypothetical protein [Halomonadaceae]|uniref:hypothetical protein n=1 Tax=Halomonadaceae TaxID=28256 RepID=UPI000C3240F9|nr:hypothetical protein [Halomonas sp. MES3-P3E]PKG50339.1 hypothetical protein CXF87_11305 [Halomonas sp. MES3-P3E]
MPSTHPLIDPRIFELLRRQENTTFTVKDLRNQYAERHSIEAQYRAHLRRFIYERISRLIRVGMVQKDTEKRKRDQRYQVIHLDAQGLDLTGEPFESWCQRLVIDKEKTKTKSPACPSPHSEHAPISRPSGASAKLRKNLKEVKVEFLAALGEAEKFKALIHEYPELKEVIQGDSKAAHDLSSRLLGHINAIEKVLQRVETGP